MPTYEYRCNKCGEQFDVFQTFAEEPLKKHPGKCGGKVVKVMSAAGIVFSGSGFYKTDNRDSSRSRSNGKAKEPGGSETKESTSTSSTSSDSGSSPKSDSASSTPAPATSSSGDGKKST